MAFATGSILLLQPFQGTEFCLLEGGNPNARHHGKGLERATFCHGVELSYCLVTVRALTETWYQECEQTLIILLLSI